LRVYHRFGGIEVQQEKGRDIGYALTISFRKEVDDVDALTVTALDVITAFAVPNVSGFSQNRRFCVVWFARWVTPLGWSPSLLRIAFVFGANPFGRRR
jgi:hypothetical protein